jgi:histidinol phosphatase-like enzyme (inositol monophosphatase family)
MDIKYFLSFGNMLADESRKISLKYYKKNIDINSKSSSKFDPVTIADLAIQKRINNLIIKKYSNHSIIGEEQSLITDSEYEWCIDPIDGTRSFINGYPMWGTLISLSKNNKIILGIADMPALDERYIGYEKLSYKIINNKKKILKVKKNKQLSKSTLSSTSPYLFDNKKDQASFNKLSKKVNDVHYGGNCYAYCLLADGHIDIIVESGLGPWDIRALVPIVKNAGGTIKTWNNADPKDGGRIIAANEKSTLIQSQSILLE